MSELHHLPLQEFLQLDTASCVPVSLPSSMWHHHSLPAWDTSGGPAFEKGADILSNKFLITRPCVLVSKLNPRIPRVSVVSDVPHGQLHCASTEFMVFCPRRMGQDLRYWGHFFASSYFVELLSRVATGTTNSHVRVRPPETLNWLVPNIEPEQQRRIADILDAADEAIQRTEAVIAKLKLMKDGVLPDLLIRGLDAHGRVRDPTAHPEQFKDSPLGRIPKDWICTEMAKVTTAAEYGVSVPLFDGGETPVLRMNNLSGGHIDLGELRYSSEAVAGKLLLQRGDILFNRTNSIDHVGRTSIWNGELARASFASYCVRFTSHRDTVTPEFLVYFMNLPQTQLAIKRLSTPAVQQVNVNPTKLRQQLLVVYPERMKEQEQIVQMLQATEESVCMEQKELQKLRLQKTGLMHDLLIGRVSV